MSYWRAGVSQTCKNTVAPMGILANVLVARWRFADVQKHRSANRNRGEIPIGALVLKGFYEDAIGPQ